MDLLGLNRTCLTALSNVLHAEHNKHACTELLLQCLSEFADQATSIDLGEWLEMYAFDVIGKIFFGRQFGFIDSVQRHDRVLVRDPHILAGVAPQIDS